MVMKLETVSIWYRLNAHNSIQLGVVGISQTQPHLSHDLIRRKRVYCQNCSLIVGLYSFSGCTIIWAAHSFSLTRFCFMSLGSLRFLC